MPGNTKLAVAAVRLTSRVQLPRKREKNLLFEGVMDEDVTLLEPVEVHYTALSPEALRGVIEAFVLREGTDYDERE